MREIKLPTPPGTLRSPLGLSYSYPVSMRSVEEDAELSTSAGHLAAKIWAPRRCVRLAQAIGTRLFSHHTYTEYRIIVPSVDNPEQAPLRPAPTLVTTYARLQQIRATHATIHPCMRRMLGSYALVRPRKGGRGVSLLPLVFRECLLPATR